ncbi:MAG: hypothetical protein HYV17_07920 [Xanthomonadales bacterium]|nr:hypothetical protein [Xanthomonadales bacterium]
MSPLLIQFLLRSGGYGLADIARGIARRKPDATGKRQSITPPAIHAVINGRSRSRRIENRIAVLLKKPLHEIWPQWYSPNGERIEIRRRHVPAAERQQRITAFAHEFETAKPDAASKKAA